jgi:hypothetical protein
MGVPIKRAIEHFPALEAQTKCRHQGFALFRKEGDRREDYKKQKPDGFSI